MVVRLDTSVGELGLCGRLPRVCRLLRVKTVADLLDVAPGPLLSLPGVGIGTVAHFSQVQDELRDRLVRGNQPVDHEFQGPELKGKSGASVPSKPPRSASPLADMGVSDRLVKACEALNLKTVGDILYAPASEVLLVAGCGAETVQELRRLQRSLWSSFDLTGVRQAAFAKLPRLIRGHMSGVTTIDSLVDSNAGEHAGASAAHHPLSRTEVDSEVQQLLDESGLADTGLTPEKLRIAYYANSIGANGIYLDGVDAATASQHRRRVLVLLESDARWRAEMERSLQAPTLREVICHYASYAVPHERHRMMWLLRHGVMDADATPLTLDQVAKSCGVTRECVRQHETKARKALVSTSQRGRLAPIADHLQLVASQCLGICTSRHLAEELQRRFNWTEAPRDHELPALFEILGDGLVLRNGAVEHSDECEPLLEAVGDAIADLVKSMAEARHVADFAHDVTTACGPGCLDPNADCRHRLFSCGARSGHRRAIPELYIRAFLVGISPPVLDGDSVLPRNVAVLRFGRRKKDVVEAALATLGNGGTHYRDLAVYVRENSDHFQGITDRAVHACLTSYRRFVDVGRGAYALDTGGGARNAPRKHVTVTRAIAAFLTERNGPVSQREIVEHLESSGFREANIVAALGKVRRFQEAGHRLYTLRGSDVAKKAKGVRTTSALVVIDPGEDSRIHLGR